MINRTAGLRFSKQKRNVPLVGLFLFSLFCFSGTVSNVFSDDKSIVDARVKSAVNRVLEVLKDKKMEREVKKKEVRAQVDALFDTTLMAKLVLGRAHWPKFSEEQKKVFTELFIKALQDSYFDKVELLTDEYVEFDKPEPAGEKFQMMTYIIAKAKRYKMLFKLYKKKDVWLVYDAEIEGISFVRSYSAQYDEFLQKNSPKDLLTKLREKAMDVPEELKAKKSAGKNAEPATKNTP